MSMLIIKELEELPRKVLIETILQPSFERPALIM